MRHPIPAYQLLLLWLRWRQARYQSRHHLVHISYRVATAESEITCPPVAKMDIVGMLKESRAAGVPLAMSREQDTTAQTPQRPPAGDARGLPPHQLPRNAPLRRIAIPHILHPELFSQEAPRP